MKETDYNSKIAKINTKVSSIDAKNDQNETKNKSILNKLIGQ